MPRPRFPLRHFRLATGLLLILSSLKIPHSLAINFPQDSQDQNETLIKNESLSQNRANPTSHFLKQESISRTALVIGNAAYQESELSNPVNDATDVAQTLGLIGFEVTLHTDLDWYEMDSAIADFEQKLPEGGIGVFYYAGHGVSVAGENYLVPTDAQLERESHVNREAVALSSVRNLMERSNTAVNVLIIDACRNNPFYRQWTSGNRSTSAQRGLSDVRNLADGTVLAFATQPGGFANDGEGRNSPYTTHLLNRINTRGEDLITMFRKVHKDVYKATNEEQRPTIRDSLIGDFSFNPGTPLNTANTQEPNDRRQNVAMQSSTTAALAQLSFPDVQDELYSAEINRAVQLGVMSGFAENDSFRPHTSLSREQLASLIVDVFVKQEIINLFDDPSSNPYSDVSKDRWSARKISIIKSEELMTTRLDGLFHPTEPATRADLVSALQKVAGYARGRNTFQPNQSAYSFIDIDEHWAENAIREMSTYCRAAAPANEAGLYFLPESAVTRGYVAAGFIRLLECSE